MPCCGECEAIDRQFAGERAAKEVATYSKRGPTGTSRLILRALADVSPPIESILDVGAGIGVLHHEMIERGALSAVHVEASSTYIEAARQESRRRGHAPRVRFLHGDFLALAPAIESADLVTLDRVVCCYPAFEPLIRLSVKRARRYYAVSFPHDRWYVRAGTRFENFWRRRGGNPFRTFVHPVSEIIKLIETAGFVMHRSFRTPVWQVLVAHA
jgi:magnesium-protoporphyrin O-methyltransferase